MLELCISLAYERAKKTERLVSLGTNARDIDHAMSDDTAVSEAVALRAVVEDTLAAVETDERPIEASVDIPDALRLTTTESVLARVLEEVIENAVERGLYICESCRTVANADINGAENIREKVLPSPALDGGERDTGWMAQPAVRLFVRSEGRFAPRE